MEPKPCPFCKGKKTVHVIEDNNGKPIVYCDCNDGCAYDLEDWNERPVEDALRNQKQRLIRTGKELALYAEVGLSYFPKTKGCKAAIDEWHKLLEEMEE